jgi:hypothetical protein
MNGLCECYFIGGEWDGVRKRMIAYQIIKVNKTKTIEHKTKHYVFREDTTTTTIEYEEDVYWRVESFSDGVTVYRLKEDLCAVTSECHDIEMHKQHIIDILLESKQGRRE